MECTLLTICTIKCYINTTLSTLQRAGETIRRRMRPNMRKHIIKILRSCMMHYICENGAQIVRIHNDKVSCKYKVVQI